MPPLELAADLQMPANPRGVIVFAHGSGSSRLSPRNRAVADDLNRRGFATLLLDLLTESEAGQRRNVFDIDLLAERLAQAVAWIDLHPELATLPLGLFGASTGAGAALKAAARLGERVGAVVSRGGRPDLAGEAALAKVRAPTLLIVGGDDHGVIELNRAAIAVMALQEGAQARAGRHPPVRGARDARSGDAAGRRLVRAHAGGRPAGDEALERRSGQRRAAS